MSEILLRKDIPEQYKWDPTHLYATQEAWEAYLKAKEEEEKKKQEEELQQQIQQQIADLFGLAG